MGANETRAAVAQVENQAGISNGTLQGIYEHTTGWREGQSALPKWRREGIGSKADEIAESALRLQQKAMEFNGITPLAIDAYLRGDKATRESLKTGVFPEKAVEDMYGVLKRSEKYGGEKLTDQDIAEMQSIFGVSPKSLDKYERAKPPKIEGEQSQQPAQQQGLLFNPNAQLMKGADGRFMTDDPLLNTIMHIESKGDPTAVSSTGAKGLFQFTSDTGSDYGLVDKKRGIDKRFDPNANFEAMKRLTANNIKGLQRNGIPVTPSTVYMAHQQGLGGTIAIYKAAMTGKPVSKELRYRMDVNGGKGLSAKEFVAKWENKVNSLAGDIGEQQNTALASNESQVAIPDVGMNNNVGSNVPDTQLNNEQGSNDKLEGGFEIAKPEQYMAEEVQPQVDWKALAKRAFLDKTFTIKTPESVSKAIKGVLGSAMV
ncbi:transglycosylase SLT domain-containing protein [Pasteurellaceae bacterium HPA106]|uniref:transglycosylase SLT domain-containing protein n=1 Tax=Spirabiliibacterium pneumoniae TaxID=221400 RepID=UPI001AAD4F02|nr:transglycosylase SLT domain-containing protein [Spirabiliibacterium pneumoniae]MBE2895526.1 transglycosylase SLT domain-containing protein [Spirabiliibacterium pneumoniae]